MKSKRYSELIKLQTFEERYKYLKLNGRVGEDTFGSSRYLNQSFYSSNEWRRFRREIIIRDNGCDLGIEGREIPKGAKLFIHHINPISVDDLCENTDLLMDPENVICCSYNTHQAIHFGDESILSLDIVERKPNDTIPWR